MSWYPFSGISARAPRDRTYSPAGSAGAEPVTTVVNAAFACRCASSSCPRSMSVATAASTTTSVSASGHAASRTHPAGPRGIVSS